MMAFLNKILTTHKCWIARDKQSSGHISHKLFTNKSNNKLMTIIKNQGSH